MMRIAFGSTAGPDYINLQLGLWRHAVAQFRQLQSANSVPPPNLLTDPQDASEGYSWNEFEVDAAVAVVLAGTSLSQLLGQNTKQRRRDGGIYGLWRCVNDVLGLDKDQTTADFQAFVDLYECLKHFGEPHHEKVAALNVERLCAYMAAAQDFWVQTLKHLNMPMPKKLFNNDFTMDVVEG